MAVADNWFPVWAALSDESLESRPGRIQPAIAATASAPAKTAAGHMLREREGGGDGAVRPNRMRASHSR